MSDIRIIGVIDAFGKNEQVKKGFWTLFVAVAGLVLARVVDSVTAQQIVGRFTGMGGKSIGNFSPPVFPLFFLRLRERFSCVSTC